MKQNNVNQGTRVLGISLPLFTILILLIILSAVYFFRPSAEIKPTESTLHVTQSPTVSLADIQPEKLTGKWQRTDGSYVLELKSPAKEGLIEASYFNPNPIHVGKSAWQQKDGMLRVLVELQDKNYPGSLYTLTYNPVDDQLRGTYFQAVERTSYDVAFTRIP